MANFNFIPTWERIKETTNLKKIIDLAGFLGTSQQNVSKKKKEDNFPVEWAYKIAKKYGLNIEWILEGTGPQHPGQGSDDPEIIRQIGKWIKDEERKQPGALTWFSYDIRKKYPEFDRWEKREEGDSAEPNAGIKENTA